MFDDLQKKLNKEELVETYGLQCLFRDDNTVIFRRLPIKHTALVEENQGLVLRGWKHYYKTQYPFNGYRGLPSGMVTLSFERDIILDPHKILDEKEKPTKNITINDLSAFSDIAANRFRQIASKKQESIYIDKLTLMLGLFLLLEGIGIIVKVLL